MALPVIAAFVPPLIKWLFGSYIVATASTIVVSYTVLTFSVFHHFWSSRPDVFESVKPGLYNSWKEIDDSSKKSLSIHPSSFPGFDILKTVQKKFNNSSWYKERCEDAWYSLALNQVQFEVQDKIYATDRYLCQSEHCRVYTEFKFEGMKVPEAIQAGVETIIKLPGNYTNPTVIPMKFDIPESDGINIIFQSIFVHLELIKRYRNDSSSEGEMFEFSLPIAYDKTRIGIYSKY